MSSAFATTTAASTERKVSRRFCDIEQVVTGDFELAIATSPDVSSASIEAVRHALYRCARLAGRPVSAGRAVLISEAHGVRAKAALFVGGVVYRAEVFADAASSAVTALEARLGGQLGDPAQRLQFRRS